MSGRVIAISAVVTLALAAACTPLTPVAAADTSTGTLAPADSVPATIAGVLRGASRIGDTVTVTGTCIGLDAGKAVGAPPLTRSDWQVSDGTQAIWVTGVAPSGCRLGESQQPQLTLHGIVRQDTLPRLGTGNVRTRYFLERVR